MKATSNQYPESKASRSQIPSYTQANIFQICDTKTKPRITKSTQSMIKEEHTSHPKKQIKSHFRKKLCIEIQAIVFSTIKQNLTAKN
jgi:hypothetical protein